MKYLINLLFFVFISFFPSLWVFGQNQSSRTKISVSKASSIERKSLTTENSELWKIINRIHSPINSLDNLPVTAHEVYQSIETIKKSLEPLKDTVQKAKSMSEQGKESRLVQVNGFKKWVPMDRDGHTTEVFRITGAILPAQTNMKNSELQIAQDLLSQRSAVQNTLYHAQLADLVMQLFYSAIRVNIVFEIAYREISKNVHESLLGDIENIDLKGYSISDQMRKRLSLLSFIQGALGEFHELIFILFPEEFSNYENKKKAVLHHLQQFNSFSRVHHHEDGFPTENEEQKLFFNGVSEFIKDLNQAFERHYQLYSLLRDFMLELEKIYKNNETLINDYASVMRQISEKESGKLTQQFHSAKDAYFNRQAGMKPCLNNDSSGSGNTIGPIFTTNAEGFNPSDFSNPGFQPQECVDVNALNGLPFNLDQALFTYEQSETARQEMRASINYYESLRALHTIDVPPILYETFLKAKAQVFSNEDTQLHFYGASQTYSENESNADHLETVQVANEFFQLQSQNEDFIPLLEEFSQKYANAEAKLSHGGSVHQEPGFHYLRALDLFVPFDSRFIFGTEDKAFAQTNLTRENYFEQNIIFLESLGIEGLREDYDNAFSFQQTFEKLKENIYSICTNYAIEGRNYRGPIGRDLLRILTKASDDTYGAGGKFKGLYDYPFQFVDFILDISKSDHQELVEWIFTDWRKDRLTNWDIYLKKAPEALRQAIQILVNINQDLTGLKQVTPYSK